MAQYERLEADAPELEFRCKNQIKVKGMDFLLVNIVAFLGDESQQQGDARPAQTGPSRGWTDQSTRTGPAPIWSIDYHQKWFDVDTATASPIHSPTSSLSLMTCPPSRF